MSRKRKKYRETLVKHSDRRVHAFEELIDGCQVIKMYNWEQPMKERVSRLRHLESTSIWCMYLLQAINMCSGIASVPIIGSVTYACCLGHRKSVENI